MKRLLDQVAVVTGGGTGIGRGVALALSKEGARVVICGRRHEPLTETASEIRKIGGDVLAIQADVSKEGDVQHLMNSTLDAYGRVDILLNNAGIFEDANTYEMDMKSWDRVMNVNLRGPMLMIRHVLPHMRKQRSGHIINISSESGLSYYTGDAVYGVSKHALNDLGEFVQRENQELNIRVNTICPGMVVSEMTRDTTGLNKDKCLYPEDIADLVVWLLTRRPNLKIGTPILIQTMQNPWE